MHLAEIGMLPPSVYFFFTPPKAAQELFLYPILCGHLYCSKEYYIKRETYPPLLLLYVCAGTFCLNTNGAYYEAGPGQAVLFDCLTPHHYYAKEEGLEFYYVHIDGANAHELCQYINQTSGVVIDGSNNETLRQMLSDLVQQNIEKKNESMFSGSQRLYTMLSLLDNAAVSPRLRNNDDSIARAIAYIRSHIGEKITLGQLAALSGLSTFYFSHLFKEMTGFSPMEFIINSRIDQAKSLLSSTNLPVSEIARRVGYANSSTLIPLFLRRTGQSPLQFRKSEGTQTVRPKQ